MSHTAIVAYKNSDDKFDLHYSRNGAERYQLKDMLDRYLEGEFEKSGGNMPGLLPTEVAEFAAKNEMMVAQEFDLINTEPFAEDIDAENIHNQIFDLSAEMLYVVRDWRVDVFAIIPITPSILPILAESVVLNIYDCENLRISPAEAVSSKTQPTYRLSGTDFFDMSLYDDMDFESHYAFAQYHLDILEGINREIQNRHSSKNHEEVSRIIMHGQCAMEYEVTDIASPVPSMNLFIETWAGTAETPTYPWEFDGTVPFPREFLNDVRLESSRQMMVKLQNEITNLRLDSISLSAMEALRRAENSGRLMFESMVSSKYADHVSSEFTTPELLDSISLPTYSDS